MLSLVFRAQILHSTREAKMTRKMPRMTIRKVTRKMLRMTIMEVTRKMKTRTMRIDCDRW
jgi:hypothetical protein